MHDQGRNQWRLMPQTYRKRDDRAAVMPTGAAVEWAVCEGDLVRRRPRVRVACSDAVVSCVERVCSAAATPAFPCVPPTAGRRSAATARSSA